MQEMHLISSDVFNAQFVQHTSFFQKVFYGQGQEWTPWTKMDTFFMDRMDKLPNNLQLTIYNLHRLRAPAHAKYSVCSVVKKAFRPGSGERCNSGVSACRNADSRYIFKGSGHPDALKRQTLRRKAGNSHGTLSPEFSRVSGGFSAGQAVWHSLYRQQKRRSYLSGTCSRRPSAGRYCGISGNAGQCPASGESGGGREVLCTLTLPCSGAELLTLIYSGEES